ncbi:MAG: hypothetical protein WCA81_01565 [Rhizomicrobium sp.]
MRILLQLLVESELLSLTGSVAGILVGIIVSFIIFSLAHGRRGARLPPTCTSFRSLRPLQFFSATIRHAKLNPIDALHYE